MGFRCSKCSYRTEANKNFRECPWCGRIDGMEKDKDADGLLDEITGVLNDDA